MMKTVWFVTLGLSLALVTLGMNPALGQSPSQQITVSHRGPNQRLQIGSIAPSPAAIMATPRRQETQLRINFANLNQSYRLTVQTSGAALTGDIKVNGRTIHRLGTSVSSLNLSPHLSMGENLVEISGTYTPAQAAVQISLVGPGTTVSHQMSGQGQLSSQIRLLVQ
ncbi:MAG: hypothetical protein ACFCVD_10130 [Nodosilinea sp.]